MKSVYISDELHRQAKIRAAEEGRTLREFVEENVKCGLQAKPAAARQVIRERAITYEVERPVLVEATPPLASDAPLAAMEAQGFVIRGERLEEILNATFARIWQQLGVEPPAGPPPSVEEIRDIVARYQAEHPEAPSLSELVIQMREEF